LGTSNKVFIWVIIFYPILSSLNAKSYIYTKVKIIVYHCLLNLPSYSFRPVEIQQNFFLSKPPNKAFSETNLVLKSTPQKEVKSSTVLKFQYYNFQFLLKHHDREINLKFLLLLLIQVNIVLFFGINVLLH